MPNKTFPDALRIRRAVLKHNQTEAAAKCGVHQNTLSQWELARTSPQTENLVDVAKYLAIDAGELLELLAGRFVDGLIDQLTDAPAVE